MSGSLLQRLGGAGTLSLQCSKQRVAARLTSCWGGCHLEIIEEEEEEHPAVVSMRMP